MNFYTKISLLVSSLLLLYTGIADLHVNYGFYNFLRCIVTVTSIVTAYTAYKLDSESKLIGIGVFAFIFNPIAPIYLNKSIWQVIDIITGVLFLIILIIFSSNKENHKINENDENIYFNKQEKTVNEVINKNTIDYSYKFEEHKKICDICGSNLDVKYYPTDGYEENNGSKIYLSGGVNICRDCLNKCNICATCGKLLPTEEIRKYIGYKMKNPEFCENLFSHEKINKLKKKYNI